MPTGRPVEITRTELSAPELRRASTRSRDADAARRMLALALVLEGKSREEAAEACGMDRQTRRDWMIRYNAEGLPGLSDRVPPGPAFRLSPEQMAKLAAIVERGPRPGGGSRRALANPTILSLGNLEGRDALPLRDAPAIAPNGAAYL